MSNDNDIKNNENFNTGKLNTDNDFARSRVPKEDRRSLLSMSVVLIGFCISMAGLYTGAALIGGLNFRQAIIASILGNIILTVYSGLVGSIGAREGVSTSLLTRHSFGMQGSKIISIIFALTLVGWFAYQCGFFGNTIHTMFPNLGIISHPVVAGIWGGILMMFTAFLGFKGLAVLSNIAAPAIILVSGIGLFIASASVGGIEGMSSIAVEGSLSLNAGVTMVVGAFAVGGVIQPDITRYAKKTSHAIIATSIGYIFAHSFVIIAGYVMTLTTEGSDIAVAMLQTVGVFSLIVLIFAQWTTNDNNLYSSSLAFSNVLPISKKKIVLYVGSIATLIGAFGVANYLVGWLVILGTGVPPVAGIIVADYFVFNKSKYEYGLGTKYIDVKVEAFIAWGIALIVGFGVTWGISAINSLVVGFISYILVRKIFSMLNINGNIGETFESESGLTSKKA
jgi:cytosine permease